MQQRHTNATTINATIDFILYRKIRRALILAFIDMTISAVIISWNF